MSIDSTHSSFRLVRRGYEPTEVDQRITDLMKQAGTSQQRIVELTSRVRELEAAQRLAADSAATPHAAPTFADLGARVGQILALAEEEAAEIRSSAKSDFEDRLREAEQSAEKVRAEADAYATQRRADADEEAGSVVGKAHQRADELHEETKRDSEARRGEAEALYEAQQAKAAQAAADFETTLAERRDRVEKEFAAQFEATRGQLAEAQAHLEETRNEAQRIRGDAETGARRQVEDAQQEAASIVEQARAHADRIAAESDRALAAATQRRDSINAQLGNVRQMLATLTNVSPAGLLAMEGSALVPEAAEAPGPAPEVEPSAEDDVAPAAEAEAEDTETPDVVEADDAVAETDDSADATDEAPAGQPT
ncbi:MAG: hypothetical protein U0R80_07380 [Nocardioidaceae bacterium]